MKFTQTIRDYISKGTVADRANTTLTTAYVSAGEIDVRHLKGMIVYPVFDKNNATSGQIKVTAAHTAGGTHHQIGQYTNSSGTLTQELWVWNYTADANAVPIELDLTKISYLKIWTKSTGGTADAKMQIDYTATNVK